MLSSNIVFTDKEKVEFIREPVGVLGPDEVLCRAEKSLISRGTEITALRGVFDPDTNWFDWVKYPHHPGYSMSATVLEVGSNVTKFEAGDRVTSLNSHQQYFKSDSNGIRKTTENVTHEEATWISLSRVAQNGVRKAEIQMGDTVGIVGLGVIGQLTTQFARISGATKIIAIDPIVNNTSKAFQSGATDVISLKADEARDKIYELTHGGMLDVIFDATGHPSVLAPCCKLVRPYGKIILVGDTSQPSKQNLGPGVVSNFLTILGAHGSMVANEPNWFYPWTMEKTTATTLSYIQQDRLKLSHLMTHVHSPAEAQSIYQSLLDNAFTGMSIILDWTQLLD